MKSQITSTLVCALLLVVACSSIITVSEAAAQRGAVRKLSSKTYQNDFHEVDFTNEKDKQIIDGELIGYNTINKPNPEEIEDQDVRNILKNNQTREMNNLKMEQKLELEQLKNERTTNIHNLNNKHNAAMFQYKNTPNTYTDPKAFLQKLKKKQEKESVDLENNYKQKIDALLRNQEEQIERLEEQHRSVQEELERSVQLRINERNQIRQQEDEKKRLEIEHEENLAKLSNEDAKSNDELLNGQNGVSGNSLDSNLLTLKPILDVLLDIRQIIQTILTRLLY